MAKKLRYRCSSCGQEETGWTGRCPACGEWGTMEEVYLDRSSESKSRKAGYKPTSAVPLRTVEINQAQRLDTGIEELNRVLGGGLVRDSVTMLTARPGAGKSTLLLQVAGKLAEQGIRTLYASGEESASQIRLRAERILNRIPEEIYLFAGNSMDDLIGEADRLRPQVLFLDSVQTFALEEYPQRQGSPTQTVQITSGMVDLCKQPDRPMASFLIGHMTKGDEMAGLRTLEHLVDTVLFLEQGGDENLRLLRSTKNRFGYTGEIGLFVMEEGGLMEVTNPYELFLTRRRQAVSGSAVALQKEGSRLIPIEMEALVSPSFAPYPTRIGDSIKRDDLNTLISILELKLQMPMGDKNVVLKATGGLSVREKSCDLAILSAIASSEKKLPIPEKVVFIAEVGLTGELKRVGQMERRLKELDRLGFEHAFISTGYDLPDTERLQVHQCTDLREVFRTLFSSGGLQAGVGGARLPQAEKWDKTPQKFVF